MESHVKDVVREMTKASDEERIVFPDVVQPSIGVGLELRWLCARAAQARRQSQRRGQR
jgi:hypothetical protein